MKQQCLTNIDMIKFFASICIVFHHYQQLFNYSFSVKAMNFYGGFIQYGYFVELFFIISGFLAAYTLKIEQKFVLVSFIIIKIYQVKLGGGIWNINHSIPSIITSFLLVNQGWIIEYTPAINNPIWYICVLIWLYLIYYAIEKLISKIRSDRSRYYKIILYILFTLLGVLGWHFRFDAPFVHLSDCRGYASFFIGVMLFDLYKNQVISSKAIKIYAEIFFVIGILVILITRNFNWYIWTLIICPSIVVFLVFAPMVQSSLISEKNIRGISFQIYLWHVPVFYGLQLLIEIFNIEFKHGFISMIVTCIFVIFLAVILNKFWVLCKTAHTAGE